MLTRTSPAFPAANYNKCHILVYYCIQWLSKYKHMYIGTGRVLCEVLVPDTYSYTPVKYMCEVPLMVPILHNLYDNISPVWRTTPKYLVPILQSTVYTNIVLV